jgi:hypothetical protein
MKSCSGPRASRSNVAARDLAVPGAPLFCSQRGSVSAVYAVLPTFPVYFAVIRASR